MKTTKQVRSLAKELWLVGYTEKLRVNKSKLLINFEDNLNHENKMAWLAIAKHVINMNRNK
jgi:hypothetical protein